MREGRVRIPKYLQHDRVQEVLQRIASIPDALELYLDFKSCVWADHFELQKLAVHLADHARRIPRLHILISLKDGLSGGQLSHLDFVDYACRVRFFSFLFSFWSKRLSVKLNDEALSADAEGSVENHILSRLPEASRPAHEHSRTYIPLTEVVDQHAVDQMAESFTAGDSIQQLLAHYTDMDFLRSGEFATLVVAELSQNIIEHAWLGEHVVGPRPAAVSLVTANLGARKDPHSRFSARMSYAPQYERNFLAGLEGPGYLELCVSDSGIGIPGSLRRSGVDWATWFQHEEGEPSDAELLAASFWAKVTRDAGPHRPGYRGLFYVLECVREYRGALSVHCSGLELSLAANSQPWLVEYTRRDALRPTTTAETQEASQGTKGTHLRVLLPLAPRLRRRSHWNLKVVYSPLSLASEKEVSIPQVRAVPAALEGHPAAAQLRGTMEDFRVLCRRVLGSAEPLAGDQSPSAIWLSGCVTRTWKKHHFQTFLDEFLAKEDLGFLCLVNIPRSNFFPFLFVARHVVPIELGRILLLVDESGRIALVYRENRAVFESFMQWAVDRSPIQVEVNDPVLISLISAIQEKVPALSLCHLLIEVGRAGISLEFSDIIERYRNYVDPVRIDKDCSVVGYVELDEALREAPYLRAISSFVGLCIKGWLRPNGIVAVRRAATRLLEFAVASSDVVWAMPSPDKEYLPSFAWLDGKNLICIVTDVVARGSTLARLITDILERRGPGKGNLSFVLVAPLMASLVHEVQLASACSLEHSAIPGLSFLCLADGSRYPLIWVQQASATLVVAVGAESLVPDSRTNIIVEAHRRDLGQAAGGDVDPVEFIRAAESQGAIWIGHLAITGDHFDVEFDMTRLLRDGSPVLRGFSQSVAQCIAAEGVDTVLFPDESRIQLAIPAVEDELRRMDHGLPRIVRCRRGADRLFIRSQDEEMLARAENILLLDDAINTGVTARRMLEIGALFPRAAKSLLLYVLISRQDDAAEKFILSVSAVKGVQFRYRAYTRVPIRFFTPEECPLCKRLELAKAFAANQGPPSPVTIPLQFLAQSLRANDAYHRSSRSYMRLDSRRRYTAPVVRQERVEVVHFRSSRGARAALSMAAAAQVRLTGALVNSLLDACSNDLGLRSYMFYALAIQGGAAHVWEEKEFRERFVSCCVEIGSYFRIDHHEGEHAAAVALVDLCIAAWFAPTAHRIWAVGALFRHCSIALNYDRFYQELLFLVVKLKSEIRGVGELGDSAPLMAEVNAGLSEARKREAGMLKHSAPPLDSIERLMRLRQLAQILESAPFREPWLEGVVELLERLSFVAGHERIPYVSRRDVAIGADLLGLVEARIGGEEVDPLSPLGKQGEMERAVDAFLASSREGVIRISRALKESFGGWFKALEWANELHAFNQLEAQLMEAEEAARALAQGLTAAEVERRKGFEYLLAPLRAIHESQIRLRDVLYERQLENGATLRSAVEGLLCPLYSLASSFKREAALRGFSEFVPWVRLTGDFFDYMDLVGEPLGPRKQVAKWTVLLAPIRLVEAILLHVIVDNTRKHVLEKMNRPVQVSVEVGMSGLDSLDHKLAFRVEIAVEGKRQEIPSSLLAKTVGAQRRILLNLYGGDVRLVSDGETGESGGGCGCRRVYMRALLAQALECEVTLC